LLYTKIPEGLQRKLEGLKPLSPIAGAATGWTSEKRSSSGLRVFERAFDSSTRWTFLAQTLGVLKSCHSHRRTPDSQSRLCL